MKNLEILNLVIELPSKLRSLLEVVSALEMEDPYPSFLLSHFAAQIGFWVKVEERRRRGERGEEDEATLEVGGHFSPGGKEWRGCRHAS